MSQKLKVELQDENGNIYYLHTAADVVFLDDGTTVEAALEKKVTASGGDISNTKLATLAASSTSFPVPAAGDAPKTLWGKVKKWQQDCLAKFANYVLTSAITNQYLNDTSKIPTAALMYLLKQEVNGLNSDLVWKSILDTTDISESFVISNAYHEYELTVYSGAGEKTFAFKNQISNYTLNVIRDNIIVIGGYYVNSEKYGYCDCILSPGNIIQLRNCIIDGADYKELGYDIHFLIRAR